MKVYDLKINNIAEPLGIDSKQITISWRLESDKKNITQKAIELQIYYGDNIVYDSKLVDVDFNYYVAKDIDLMPHRRYTVKLTVLNNRNEQATAFTHFSTGFIDSHFDAKLITYPQDKFDTVPFFLKSFQLDNDIEEAYLYITALGTYNAKINGMDVTESILNPGFTSYKKRLLYQTYDVKSLLSTDNKIEVSVAKGWYSGRLGFMNISNIFGNRSALMLSLVVRYKDGRECQVNSDSSFEVISKGLLDAEIYDGEVWDYTKKEISYGNALEYQPDFKVNPQHELYEYVVIQQELKPIKLIITPKKEIVYDFGQNISGFVKIKLPKTSNKTITIWHGETLDKEGNFYRENLRAAQAREIYTYDDDMVGKWVHPKFTYHGFRYIKIEGVDAPINENEIFACFVATNNEDISSFECDNRKINQLFSNIKWSIRDNFVDVPTDCPQRDERLGWTGDAQTISRTASYLLDCKAFYKKWQQDCILEFTKEHGPAHNVPNIFSPMDAAALWSDAITFVPWNMYQAYGDISLLAESYDTMKAYITYLEEHSESNGLWQSGRQYGDWLALDGEIGRISGSTDIYLAANAYYMRSLQFVRDSAKALNKLDDYKVYCDKYKKLKASFNREYVTSTGRLVTETQTACALALAFDLVYPKYKNRVVQALIENLAHHELHITTGFMGIQYLCEALTQNGYHDIAAKVFLQEDYPSWLYSVNMGATTIWERWNSILPDGSFNPNGMNSLNHCSIGSIGAWMVESIVGLKPIKPGFKEMQIMPCLIPSVNKLEYSYKTPYGVVEIRYEIKEKLFALDIKVPANTKAKVVLLNKQMKMVGSGNYHFECELPSLNKMLYTVYDPIYAVLENPKGKEYFKQNYPQVLRNPELRFIKKEGLYNIKPLLPNDKKDIIKELLHEINN